LAIGESVGGLADACDAFGSGAGLPQPASATDPAAAIRKVFIALSSSIVRVWQEPSHAEAGSAVHHRHSLSEPLPAWVQQEGRRP
jgi:hypothetical protein